MLRSKKLKCNQWRLAVGSGFKAGSFLSFEFYYSLWSKWLRAYVFALVLLGNGLNAQGASLEEIQKRGYLKIAVKDNLRPLGFRDDQGNLVGFEVDLARRLAEALLGNGEALKLYPVANEERLSVVVGDRVDMAIAKITVTESRSRIVSFSYPYYMDGTGLITRIPGINSLEDLEGARIAVLNGSTTIADLQYFLPSADLMGVNSYQEAKDRLALGEALAFAGDISVLAGWVQEDRDYHTLSVIVSAEALAIAMPKGLQYDSLRRRVNELMVQWYTEKWLQERAIHWELPLTEYNR